MPGPRPTFEIGAKYETPAPNVIDKDFDFS